MYIIQSVATQRRLILVGRMYDWVNEIGAETIFGTYKEAIETVMKFKLNNVHVKGISDVRN